MPLIGRYALGEYFVENPVGGAGITIDATPATDTVEIETTDGLVTATVHGASTTEGFGSVSGEDTPIQGYHNVPTSSQRVPYRDTKNTAGSPVQVPAGDEVSYCKSVTSTEPVVNDRAPILAESVFTVVNGSPPVGAFRPGIASPSKTAPFTTSDIIDLDTLPRLPFLPGQASYLTVVNNLRRVSRAHYGFNSFASYVTPDRNSPSGAYPVREAGVHANHAIILLCMDYPLDVKTLLAKCIIQRAIDAAAYLENRDAASYDYGGVDGTRGLGGVAHHAFKESILVASLLLGGDAGLRAVGQGQNFVQDGQFNYVTQPMIDEVREPYAGRPTADYQQVDLGMPEWVGGNRYKNSTAGNRHINAAYRQISLRYHVTMAMAVHLFPGHRALYDVGNTAFIDYCDRIFERDFFEDPADPMSVFQWGKTQGIQDDISTWELGLWENYRAGVADDGTGSPLVTEPIWDWTDI